ncbi:MAG: methylated-DNA--[protein]-cysteine S-methyltransferase [Actinomycetota bacterium]|nr:methylated-DNA--[protein]-cysteine S-methyltransferase [Actinomycetota bacterium]
MTPTTAELEIRLQTLHEPAPDAVLFDVLIGSGIADAFVRATSPAGELYIAASAHGVTCVRSAGDDENFRRAYRARFGRDVYSTSRLQFHLRSLAGGLIKEPSRGMVFDLRSCSEFERDVLLKALEIPAGEVRPYGWIAREIGNPNAVRAVGTALGHNPIPVLIPCHRVVRSDGLIGQYSLGGPARKRAMLQSEGLDPDVLENVARRGIRFVGSDTTGIYCFPTCRNAKRITPSHRVEMRSAADASARGYRPCLVCRPAGVA